MTSGIYPGTHMLVLHMKINQHNIHIINPIKQKQKNQTHQHLNRHRKST